MTDKKIEKALEAHNGEHTIGCPNCPYSQIPQCRDVLLKDVLDYIKRLKVANDELKTKFNIVWKMYEKTTLACKNESRTKE